jgi:hypothetical protein
LATEFWVVCLTRTASHEQLADANATRNGHVNAARNANAYANWHAYATIDANVATDAWSITNGNAVANDSKLEYGRSYGLKLKSSSQRRRSELRLD